jgi:hypothetical protein
VWQELDEHKWKWKNVFFLPVVSIQGQSAIEGTILYEVDCTQGVITPQAWVKELEAELFNSKKTTLPGGFEPATLKSLA